MTLLAVKSGQPQPDIGSLLEALAEHEPVALDCASSPVATETIEVHSRAELDDRLGERFPFRPHMTPLEGAGRVGVRIVLRTGPPIAGQGENLAAAIQDFLENALDYIARWEHELRFDLDHERYWGWVYRLLIAGDDDHIRSTLLDQPL